MSSEDRLHALSVSINDLIELCKMLKRENRQLKAELANRQLERQELLSKNELARSKISALIERLRTMEPHP